MRRSVRRADTSETSCKVSVSREQHRKAAEIEKRARIDHLGFVVVAFPVFAEGGMRGEGRRKKEGLCQPL